MASGIASGESFAALLRRYRQAAVLSQEELAERAGLSVGAISTLERGQRTLPRPDTVALLAQALDLSPEERAAFVVAAHGRPPAQSSADPVAADTPVTTASRPGLQLAPLPQALTGFIGRERELAALRERLLDPRVRLLTLIGPGGSGKTRLAVEVARSVETAFADGVAFVALAALTNPTLVLPAITQALGLQETPGCTPLESLQIALGRKQLLLVLDNCEQVAAAAPDIADLLVAASGIRILATSRTRLAVSGERIYPVKPLRVPSQAEVTDPATLAQVDAVQLFVVRAQEALPTFALSQENAAVVAAICAKLDGLPLAIELAAARVRHLAPTALLKRLDSSLVLLTGGPRDAPLRQQTLRETIAWSYDLLGAQEQALFRRLGVCVGGCSAEAAEAVCRLADGMAGDMLARLSALADQSLVAVAEQADGEPWFQLLGTIRVFALEQLETVGETVLVRDRHLAWYVRLAEAAEPALQGASQDLWLARLEQEHDNLRAALAWGIAGEGSAVQGLRLAAALWRFWRLHGHLSEGRSWLEQALARSDTAEAPVVLRAQICNAAGNLAIDQGDFARASALLAESLALRRTLGEQQDIASTLNNLGIVASHQGDYARAEVLWEESLALRRRLDDRWGIANSLNNLGSLANAQGNYARARLLHEESLALKRSLGGKSGIAQSLNNLGIVANNQGDYARARLLFEQSLAIERELGNKPGIAQSLNNLGRVVADQRDYTRAGALFAESLALMRDLGDKPGIAASLTNLGTVAYLTNDYTRATALFEESLALARNLGDRSGLIEVLEVMALIAGTQRQPERGVVLWSAADAARAAMGSPRPPNQRGQYEQAITALHQMLSAETYTAAWNAGKAMTLEEAITFALEPQPRP